MILDKRALLSDKQAIVATAASTDAYDLGRPGNAFVAKNSAGPSFGFGLTAIARRMGYVENVPLSISVNEDFDNLTSLTITLQSDDDSAFGTPKDVISVTVLLADLITGYYFPFDKLPRNITERYLRLNYTVVGTAPTTGKITAGFVGAVDGNNKSGF